MTQCRITVLRKTFNEDLADEHTRVPCRRFEEGQEFILDAPDPPPVFCWWAWLDILRDVTAIFYGADFPHMAQRGTAVTCCTDGIRPVTFKIERVDQKQSWRDAPCGSK